MWILVLILLVVIFALIALLVQMGNRMDRIDEDNIRLRAELRFIATWPLKDLQLRLVKTQQERRQFIDVAALAPEDVIRQIANNAIERAT